MKKKILSILLVVCMVVGLLPAAAYAYDNIDIINGGTFDKEVNNSGAIKDGTFYGTVNNYGGGIEGGTFYGTVNNNNGSVIENGIFYGDVNNNGTINGGTFYGAVSGSGTISDSAVIWTKLTKDILDNNYKVYYLGSYDYVLPSGNYYLGEDISVDITVNIGRGTYGADVTLDLNGFELKSDNNGTLLFVSCADISNTATLTLMDSSSAKTGKVISNSGVNIYINSNSKLNANGGTVEGNVRLYSDNAIIDNTDSSNVTVFTGEVANYGIIKGGTFYGEVTNKYEITGGIFYGTITGSGAISDNAKVTVTFNSNGGSDVAEQKVLRGQKVNETTAPTKAGYAFNGWYNGDTVFDLANTPVIEDITLTAKRKINQYTISFDTDGGNEIAPITQDYDTAVTKPADPKKTGYTFAGWDKEIPTTMPAKDTTIKALWKINQYTISFDTDGGNEIDPITQDYGTDVTAPADPTKEGYTFAGWDKEIPATMPAEDTTIKAQWTKNSTGGSGSSSSGGGFSGTYNYPVVISDVENGKATADKTNAVAGDKVTITVTPDAGKAVDEVIVTDADGKAITVTKAGDNKYTFTMPAGKVNIAVTTKAATYQNKIVLQIGNRNILDNNATITNDVAPVIVDNRTMVPIRVITETLGGTAHWNADTQTVTLNIDGKTLTMTIGQTISGFDTAPIILNDRTYVPVRYVAERLGAKVEWVGESQQIVITK